MKRRLVLVGIAIKDGIIRSQESITISCDKKRPVHLEENGPNVVRKLQSPSKAGFGLNDNFVFVANEELPMLLQINIDFLSSITLVGSNHRVIDFWV
jgi:hypothetical protein